MTMDIEFLARILASVVVLHTFHAIGEMNNVRAKVGKLKAAIDGTPVPEKSFQIDTNGMMVGVLLGMIIVLFGGSLLAFSLLQLSAVTLMIISIGLIVIIEIATTIGYNHYHGEISSEISKVKVSTATNPLVEKEVEEITATSAIVVEQGV
jgi:hypothetical protein